MALLYLHTIIVLKIETSTKQNYIIKTLFYYIYLTHLNFKF